MATPDENHVRKFMTKSSYRISVNPEGVEICGEITIPDAINLFIYYMKIGYTCFETNCEGLVLYKKDYEKIRKEEIKSEFEDSLQHQTNLLLEMKEENKDLKIKKSNIENLFRDFMKDHDRSVEFLSSQLRELVAAVRSENLENSPEVKKILDKYKLDETNGMATPEKV